MLDAGVWNLVFTFGDGLITNSGAVDELWGGCGERSTIRHIHGSQQKGNMLSPPSTMVTEHLTEVTEGGKISVGSRFGEQSVYHGRKGRASGQLSVVRACQSLLTSWEIKKQRAQTSAEVEIRSSPGDPCPSTGPSASGLHNLPKQHHWLGNKY